MSLHQQLNDARAGGVSVSSSSSIPMLAQPNEWPLPTDVQLIRIDENPTWPKWRIQPLYHQNVNGSEMIWQIGYDGAGLLQIYTGHLYGNPRLIETPLDQVQGKTLAEKALVDARHRYLIKYRNEGYRPAGSIEPTNVKGMLAKIWVSHQKRAQAERDFEAALAAETRRTGVRPTGGARTTIRNKFIDAKWQLVDRFPVATQAKIDGHRLMARLTNEGVYCWKPRSNRSFVNTYYQEQDLAPLFAFLPAGCLPDGELYNPDWTFETLSSVVKTEKSIHPWMSSVRLYLFDLYTPEPMPFEDRFRILTNAYRRYIEEDPNRLRDPVQGQPGVGNTIRLVTFTLANSDDEIVAFHNQYVQLGYEGLMVRKIAGRNPTQQALQESYYQQGVHSNNLLKYKEFFDEEGIVVGLGEEHTVDGNIALVIVMTKSGADVVTRPRGSHERRINWFNHPETIILKPFTYRYQEKTEYGIPRFPVGIDVRDDPPLELGLTPAMFEQAKQIIRTKYPQFARYIPR